VDNPRNPSKNAEIHHLYNKVVKDHVFARPVILTFCQKHHLYNKVVKDHVFAHPVIPNLLPETSSVQQSGES